MRGSPVFAIRCPARRYLDMRWVRMDALSSDLRRALFEWSDDPFQSKAWGLTWRPKEHHVLLYEEDRAVAHVGLVRATVLVGGVPLAVGGLGQVVTLPEFQGRGFGKACIQEAERVLREEWGLRHGLLFCFPRLKAFYEALGWVARREPVWISQPQGRVAFPEFSMAREWGLEWPEGEIEVGGMPW